MKALSTYAVGSVLSTVGAIYLAFYRYEQFYPACVNLVSGKVNQMVRNSDKT